MNYRFRQVCVAGTFEGLHAGHEAVLQVAFREGEKVIIGLTSDKFVQEYKLIKSQIPNPKSQANSKFQIQNKVAPFIQRRRALEKWLVNKKLKGRAKIVPIDDPYEPAASDTKAEALIVTVQNKARGEEINKMRQGRGLTPLALIEVPLVVAEDGQPISATRVRNGEIDNNGKLIMPESLRNTLAQPLGQVLVEEAIGRSFAENKGKIIVAVGDVATKTLLEAGRQPSLVIIDNKVGRQPYTGLKPWRETLLRNTIKVKSGPGYISKEARQAIKNCLQGVTLQRALERSWVIEVDGEEDLLALPAIVEAPLGSVVFYGQPTVAAWSCGPMISGLVEVEVTKEKKIEVEQLLSQFNRSSTI